MITEILGIIPEDLSKALVVSLLSSLCYGLIIYTALKFILRFVHETNSILRYWLSYISFLGILVITAYSFITVLNSSGTGEAYLLNGYLYVNLGDEQNVYNAFFSNIAAYTNSAFETLFEYSSHVSLAWFVGLVVSIAKYVISINGLRVLKLNSDCNGNKLLNQIVSALSGKLNLVKTPSVFVSSKICSPIVNGVIKPAVIIPLALLTGLSRGQLEIIVLHELAHLKRLDPVFKLLQSLGETLLFFNPFIRLIAKEIDIEREKCCDDIVVEETGNKILYANTLLKVAEYSHMKENSALALTGNKNQLLTRIKRIVLSSSFPGRINNRYVTKIYTSAMLSFVISAGILFSGNLFNDNGISKTNLHKAAILSDLNSLDEAFELLNPGASVNGLNVAALSSNESSAKNKRVFEQNGNRLANLFADLDVMNESFINPYTNIDSRYHEAFHGIDEDLLQLDMSEFEMRMKKFNKKIEKLEARLEEFDKLFN